jgi:uncharacterized membrane protein YeaQ/YmgE (transglycosylase-associated protein family)
LLSDGAVWAWGSNGNGLLGDGTFTGGRSIPGPVLTAPAEDPTSEPFSDVIAIASSDVHSLALRRDGTISAMRCVSSRHFSRNYCVKASARDARPLSGRTEPTGCIGTTAVGILGALLGGFIATALDIGELGTFFDLETWLIAIAGSVILLILLGAISPRRSRY